MHVTFCVVIACCLFYPFEGTQATIIGDFLRECLTRNETINNCFVLMVSQVLGPRLLNGIPQISIPPADPFSVTHLKYVRIEPPVYIDATIRDMLVFGLSAIQLSSVKIDPERAEIIFYGKVPKLYVEGSFDLQGKLIELSLDGKGPCYIHLNDIEAVVTSKFYLDKRSSEKRLQLRNTNTDYKINHINIRLQDEIPKDPIIAMTINNFVNRNGQDILKEVQPEVKRLLNLIFENAANDAFSQLPDSALRS